MARKNPTVGSYPEMPEQSKHEKMVSEMHDALYSLGDCVRKPYPRSGDKLLPKTVRPDKPEAKAARAHIERLHKAFQSEK